MNVYVESNFVLEHALEQEECDACVEVVRLARTGQVRLGIPAFSLAEPHHAIASKAKARGRLGEDLRIHLSELGRSRPLREIPAMFDTLAAALIANAQFEREGVRRTVSEILDAAEIVPLDAPVLRAAAAIEIEGGLSGQHSIVLASVIAHLETTSPAESCFLNRNSKDFDDSDIRDRLESLRCRFFAKFAPALAYIVARQR